MYSKFLLQYLEKNGVAISYVPFMSGKLCQWASSPFEVNGVRYASAEQYMMAQKADLFCDNEYREKIMATTDTLEIKTLGRGVRYFNSYVWDAVKMRIVYEGNYAKYTQCDDMRKEMFKYPRNSVFVECNPYDKVWGVGLDIEDSKVMDWRTWNGYNLLGFVLTAVRDDILKKHFYE